jgi:hypothetical protein
MENALTVGYRVGYELMVFANESAGQRQHYSIKMSSSLINIQDTNSLAHVIIV